MIVVEGTLWPVVMVGAVEDRELTASQTLMTDRNLESSERLALGLVVGGSGMEAVRAHQALLEWWHQRRQQLLPRVHRLAWVIGDETVRRSTNAWLQLMPESPCEGGWAVFPDMRSGLAWLLDTPWLLRREQSAPRSSRWTADSESGSTFIEHLTASRNSFQSVIKK